MPPKEQRTRGFCFTWNNYPTGWQEKLKAIYDANGGSYLIAGEEVGKEGTPHIQGYIHYKDAKTKRACVKIQPAKPDGVETNQGWHIHWIAAKGDVESNEAYCSKDGKNIFTIGEKPAQGYRTDIDVIKERISKGESAIDLFQDFPQQVLQYKRSIDALSYEVTKKQRAKEGFRPLDVTVIYGKSRAGKTRLAYEKHGYQEVYKTTKSNTGVWWTGYERQKAFILDEFNSSDMPLNSLLTILDGQPTDVPVHGGMRTLMATHAYICMNVSPDTLYPNVDGERRAALFNRFNRIYEITEDNKLQVIKNEKPAPATEKPDWMIELEALEAQ